MDHYARKAQLSNALREMCEDSLYPPSCEMLYARVQHGYSDMNWSDGEFKRFIKNRLELFYGVGKIILKCLEEVVQTAVSYDILRLIVELRGKDTLYIEHRDCVRVAFHLQTVCNEAGYEAVVRVLKNNVGYVGYEDALIERLESAKTTDSLKRLVVGYQFEDEMKPIYIAIPEQEYPVDVKMAWNIITGKTPSNVEAVEKKFWVIEEKVDRICQHLGQSGGIEVQLIAPVDDRTSRRMTKTMQKVTKKMGRKDQVESKGNYVNDFAREFASAVCESEGFTSLRPVGRRGKLLGISLFKTNTMFTLKPFWFMLGEGLYLRDSRIYRFSTFKKETWVFLLQHCRRQMAWNILEITENERKHKVPKNYVSISEQRRSMKACLMAQRSKNQHDAKKEDANGRNILDLHRVKENVKEVDEKKYLE